MAGEDIICMSLKELKRLKVMQEAIDGRITQKAAASIVGLSERQVRMLVKAVRDKGDMGVIHKGRGRPSNQRTPEKVKDKTLSLYRRRYPDFGPTQLRGFCQYFSVNSTKGFIHKGFRRLLLCRQPLLFAA